jgi:hypothetical protein
MPLFNWRTSGRVTLVSDDGHSDARTARFEAFATRHPLGSLLEARVLTQGNTHVRLELPGGLITRMASADYWHR